MSTDNPTSQPDLTGAPSAPAATGDAAPAAPSPSEPMTAAAPEPPAPAPAPHVERAAAPAPADDARADAEPGDGDGDGEGEAAEGDFEVPEGTPLGMLTAAPRPGEKRKRRRRRRKKGDRAQAGAPGVAGAEGAAEGEGAAASGEGSEEAEGAASEEGAESSGEPHAEGEAAGEGEKKGKRKRNRKKPGQGAGPSAPHREKPPFAVGEEVICKVTKVMPEALMLDVAGKALGIFDRREIPESELPAEGEKLLGMVVHDGSRGGLVVLTRDLNRWQKSRVDVEAAFNEKRPVEGLVTGVIRGGIEVDVDGLRGFAPASHVDLRLGADLHHMIGQRLPFEVVQFAKRGREFVLSRRAQLEAEARAHREEAIGKLEVGSVVKGTVRSITQFGVFVDVGGVDGLVHMTEASYVIKPLSELFKVNQELDVKILRVDEKGKVWLSHKAAEHDPWEGGAERYARGTRHKGKVVRLQPFGAFIELEPGIDGLLHIADIDSPKRLEHPSEVLKVGEDIEVVVASCDPEHRKVALHSAPKDGEALPDGRPPPRLALHQAVKVVVETQEAGGLGVRIVGQTGRHARGFIPASATGTPRGTDLRKAFPTGRELEAKIVELDPRKGTKLSMKALTQDQERQSFRQYQSEVKKASKFGTFGDLLKEKGITK